MQLSELKEKVAKSVHLEWYNNKIVNLDYPHLSFKIKLEGITSIYEFICNNLEGFTAIGKPLPPEIQVSVDRFKSWKKMIINIVNEDNSHSGPWANFSSNISRQGSGDFLSDNPFTLFLINLYNDSPQWYAGAYEFIVSPNLNNTHNKDSATGYILAYEFKFKGSSELTMRAKLETESIANLKNRFEEYLSNSEKHLIEHLSTSNDKVKKAAANIQNYLSEKKNEYDSWYKNASEDFDAYFSKCKASILEVEELYKEKLKLEAPAKYWKDKAVSLRKEGYLWLAGLIATIVTALGILIWILFAISNGTIDKIFSNPGTAIKWSVILITIISFLAYAVRTLAKFTFSSFHLFRDAQEREQLTYVYLALHKEKGIDQTERHLIMQSLFSRADSGLLKDDASPTMPGSIIDKVVASK